MVAIRLRCRRLSLCLNLSGCVEPLRSSRASAPVALIVAAAAAVAVCAPCEKDYCTTALLVSVEDTLACRPRPPSKAKSISVGGGVAAD